jgi:hypothetical protein
MDKVELILNEEKYKGWLHSETLITTNLNIWDNHGSYKKINHSDLSIEQYEFFSKVHSLWRLYPNTTSYLREGITIRLNYEN